MQAIPIDYADGDVALRGELYRPTAPNGCGALVVHEADGIGGNVRRRCALLAERGYVAFAADMHGGGRVLEGEAMMAAVAAFRDDPTRFRARVAAGLAALSAEAALPPSHIVALGYCFGGTAVLELARSGAEIAAVASFHGLLTTKAPAVPSALRTCIAAFTGDRDPLVPPADVEQFQREMRRAEADWQLSIYGRALHSFTNSAVADLGDPRMAYDPAADRASWAAALAFFDAALEARANAR